MKRRISALLLAALIFQCGIGPSNIMAQSAEEIENAKTSIREYVNQTLINTLVFKIGEIIERALDQTEYQLLPQMVYMAAQQAAVQCFNQPSTKDIVKDAYLDTVDHAIDSFENKDEQSAIQSKIINDIENYLEPITDDFIFQQILDLTVQNALMQQEQIIMQNMINAQVQAMNAKQQVLEQQLQSQYQQVISNATSILQ